MDIKELALGKAESKSNASAHPTRRFIGFALLLAWHYNLWFIPDAFLHTELLGRGVTYSWLFALVASAATFAILIFTLGRKRHLCDIKWMLWAATAVASISTIAITMFAFSFESPLLAYVFAILIGASNAVLWIMWGELYVHTKTSFSVARIGTVTGAVILVTSAVSLVLPGALTPIFIALMPLVAGVQFSRGLVAAEKEAYPPLLPQSMTKRALKPMIAVCAASFIASGACYYLVAIIPWEALPGGDYAFAVGSVGGALLLTIISLICAAAKGKLNIYRIFPWLIVLEVVSFALFLMGEELYAPSFFVALAVVALFELLLVMYFGVLATKGYVPAGIAFGFSGAFIRGGIATGNSLAIFYENNPEIALVATDPTAIVFVCILAALLIPIVRQEYNIVALMAPAGSASSLEQHVEEVAIEFGLSAREKEIVLLIARGFTAENVAKKLVISPYTVNTHIRHVYEKMGIHKRSELIDYLNRNSSDGSDS